MGHGTSTQAKLPNKPIFPGNCNGTRQLSAFCSEPGEGGSHPLNAPRTTTLDPRLTPIHSLNARPTRCVKSLVRLIRLAAPLLAVCAFAADVRLESLLKGAENRYNKAKTLQVLFNEEYTPPGGARRVESGLLMLRKPGRMRWVYSQPAGKLFISDSKFLWLYNPDEKRVEKMKLRESEDMRAPLAFLLGKLNFSKEFQNLQGRPDEDALRITGEPKTDTLPYSKVEFVVTDDFRIRQVKVTGYDGSILNFTFNQERVNPPLDSKLFEFQVPKGAELVETGQ